MRFRSFGVSASNMEEYISKLKVQEAEYIEESTLSHLNFMSLEPKINEEEEKSDDYALLGHKSSYRIQKLNFHKKRRRRRRLNSSQFFKKKNLFSPQKEKIEFRTTNLYKYC